MEDASVYAYVHLFVDIRIRCVGIPKAQSCTSSDFYNIKVKETEIEMCVCVCVFELVSSSEL